MINTENPIEELKSIAAEHGVCCANCAKSAACYSFLFCDKNEGQDVLVGNAHFCASFEPKPTE